MARSRKWRPRSSVVRWWIGVLNLLARANGSITLVQVAGHTAGLAVACSRYDRGGQYRLETLIARHGPDFGIRSCCDCCRAITRSGTPSAPHAVCGGPLSGPAGVLSRLFPPISRCTRSAWLHHPHPCLPRRGRLAGDSASGARPRRTAQGIYPVPPQLPEYTPCA
jgi:hypothetical protein